jgi:hypothetical protein
MKSSQIPISFGWIIYWFSFLTIFIFLEYTFVVLINPLSLPLLQLGKINTFLALLCLFISMRSVPGGYSFSKQAVCHLGRMKVKRTGANNRIAALFYLFFYLFQSSLIIIIGWLSLQYNLDIISWLCFISPIFILLTGIIPIDLSEKGHLYSALISFISINYFILLLWYHFHSTLISVNMVLLVLNGLCYCIGYVTDYRYCALFQKLWIIFTIIALNLFLEILYLQLYS